MTAPVDSVPRTGYAPVNGLQMYYEMHGDGEPLVLLHGALSATGTSFGALLSHLAGGHQVISVEQQVATIAAPVLIIIGDSDIVRPEHAVEMFRLLGGGVIGDLAGLPASQLAVLPGTPHSTLMERADLLLPMIDRFLTLD